MMNWKQAKEDPRVVANRHMADILVRSVHSFNLEALANRIRQG